MNKYRYVAEVDYGFPADSTLFNLEGDGIPLIRIRDITSGQVATWYSGIYPKKLLVHSGDILVGMDGDFGLCIWDGPDALLNQRCCRLRGGTMNDRFLYYSMAYPLNLLRSLMISTTVKHLLSSDIANITLPVPPIDEQQAIANLLDAQCAKIDAASSALEKQTAALELYRSSIIHDAVNHGLDPTVPTKPSGVNWIGNIPEDWDVTPLGYLGSFQNGISKDGDSFGEGHPFVSYGDVYSSRSLPAIVKGLVKSNTDEQSRYSVKTGDVFFTRTSETASEIAFASTCFSTIEKATFAGFLIRFRPNGNRLNPRYGSYYFRNTGLRNYFVKEMMIVTRASLGQQLLKRLPVLIPSIDEQERIADYLDARTAAIDAVLDTKRKQLDILKRSRQSLIYEYVTGKRRVTEEA